MAEVASRSPSDQLLQMFRVTRALNRILAAALYTGWTACARRMVSLFEILDLAFKVMKCILQGGRGILSRKRLLMMQTKPSPARKSITSLLHVHPATSLEIHNSLRFVEAPMPSLAIGLCIVQQTHGIF